MVNPADLAAEMESGLVTFGVLNSSNEYLAFDNIVYNSAAAVPEPATWLMMILGFGLVGGAMRYRQRHPAKVTFG